MLTLDKGMMPILFLLAGSILTAAVPEVPQQKAWRDAAPAANSEVRVSKPAFSGQSIVCGNKTVTWNPDGQIRISNGGGILLSMNPHFIYKNDRKKVEWNPFTVNSCKVKAENGKVVWNLKKKLGDTVYDAGTQTLEITPEGLLKVRCDITVINAPGWTPYYKNADFFLFLPFPRTDGKELVFNNSRIKLDSGKKVLLFSGRAKTFHYVFYPGNPENVIELKAAQPEAGTTTCYPDKFNKAFRTVLGMNAQMSCTFTLDLRKGIVEKSAPDQRGGMDFKAIENIELPDGSRRNLLQNSSFECGTAGYQNVYRTMTYNRSIDIPYDVLWNWKPFEAVGDPAAPFGKHVLRFNVIPVPNPKNDFRLLTGVNLTSQVTVVPAGTYTFSCYAKGEKGISPELRVWVPNFFNNHHTALDKRIFRLDGEWKRYSFTFKIPKTWPLEININAAGKQNGKVWLDAIQLEKGSKATAYEPVPAEGRLITSAPDNFVSAKKKIDGKLSVTTAKPDQSGEAEIRVRNFFGEILLNQKFPFRSDASGHAEIALPLDDLPGLGVFMLRTDFRLADGSKAFGHHRYAKVDFLDNTQPARMKYGFDYAGDFTRRYQCLSILDRWRKVGVGIVQHHEIFNKKLFDLEHSYGIEFGEAFMLSYFWRGGKVSGFAIADADRTISPRLYDVKKPQWLVKDFYQDSDGTVTPEYQEKLKNAVKTLVSKYPHIPMWCLGGELIAKFPSEWWSKEKTPEACAKKHAQLLKAFADGVREANPNAKIFQDDPCNMSPNGGIAETERLLRECSKLGVKFDVIAIHIYRYSPESPDLDSDAKVFFEMLDRVGYGKVPVIWPEGMNWGPFNFPQWGTVSSTWAVAPKTWPGSLLSYDMGATEKLSAAWYARAFLTALKYGDRIRGATAGNFVNNCYMDLQLTPYAAQLIPNTLTHAVGNAAFRKDIRFAPFVRAYVFEDEQKRPVAAVWCHLDKVDEGRTDAPVAEVDFGDALESVTDLMNSPRAFTAGKFRFPVNSFPLFLRGKPGTLKQMTAALEKAAVVSGSGISPLEVLANPLNRSEIKLQIRNYVSKPFEGTLNGKTLNVPASGKTEMVLPLAKPLSDHAVSRIPLDVTIKSNSGAEYHYNLSFEALPAKKLPESATFQTVDWSALPSVPFVRKSKGAKTSGTFRIGWNTKGVFIEAAVRDPKFIHTEYARTDKRWCNDCLQIYFDTLANARIRNFKGYDEDDYDYALFPNSAGNSSVVFRYRSVEQQLGLATQAPPDNTIAPDIPSSFSNKDGVLTYRVFFPAKYLLPVKLQKGWVFGFGLYAADAVQKGKVDGALTLASDGEGCYNRPHLWPAVILSE